ncbi:hypothetical protein RJT34_27873 [Clitoria ternatea]|uniref:Uncharacterized protein n=1 Tax=Clitoria ternatea TaxID=43366 RepID=A0AAN9I8Q8_CLITE
MEIHFMYFFLIYAFSIDVVTQLTFLLVLSVNASILKCFGANSLIFIFDNPQLLLFLNGFKLQKKNVIFDGSH